MRVEHHLLLAAMRAPRDPHPPVRPEAEQPAPEVRRARRVGQRLVLDVAGDDNAFRADTEGDDPARVLVRLHGEDPHLGEDGPHEATEEPIAAVGAVGDPSVGDHDRDVAGGQRSQHVGPQLRLQAHEERGVDRGHEPPRRTGQVEREEPVDREREGVADAEDRAEGVRARPQVGDLAQELHRVALLLQGVLERVGGPVDDDPGAADLGGLAFELLALRLELLGELDPPHLRLLEGHDPDPDGDIGRIAKGLGDISHE